MGRRRKVMWNEPYPRTLTITDGGMGHLLKRKGVKVQGEVGTMQRFLGVALANLDQPELVIEAHLEFMRAGAEVITTNNYACVPAAISLTGGDKKQVEDLVIAAGRAAQRATEIFREEQPDALVPMVAGCVPPLKDSYRHDL